jgi:polygalacturonase
MATSSAIVLFVCLLLPCFHAGKVGNVYPFTVPDVTYSVLTYGAKADGTTDDTSAIQAALNAAKNGGTVLFPAGNYLTFPFAFAGSNTIISIASGATILASTNKSKWPGGSSPTAFITGTNLNNLGITGSGTVNGQGSVWWSDSSATRPDLVYLSDVTRLYIQGVTFENSPYHTLELGASYAELDSITVSAPSTSPNTDGVDLHGEPFYIHDSHIAVGDDNVAIHVSNVLIENCVFGSGHGASIGSISSGTYKNITVSGVTFDGTEAGPRIKTDPGATGSISDVVYENLVLSNVQTGIIIDMFYDDGPTETTTMKISDITFSGVTGSASVAGSLKCQPSSPCTNIILKNVDITGSSGWTCEDITGSLSAVTPSSCV